MQILAFKEQFHPARRTSVLRIIVFSKTVVFQTYVVKKYEKDAGLHIIK